MVIESRYSMCKFMILWSCVIDDETEKERDRKRKITRDRTSCDIRTLVAVTKRRGEHSRLITKQPYCDFVAPSPRIIIKAFTASRPCRTILTQRISRASNNNKTWSHTLVHSTLSNQPSRRSTATMILHTTPSCTPLISDQKEPGGVYSRRLWYFGF